LVFFFIMIREIMSIATIRDIYGVSCLVRARASLVKKGNKVQ